MTLSATSKASAVGVGFKNVQHTLAVEALPRKIVIIGTFDPAKTAIVNDVPIQVFSADDAGSQLGFGFMLHRQVKAAFNGSLGVETWVVPQDEEVAAVAATGDIDFTGSTVTEAGELPFYLAGEKVPITVSVGDTGDEIATALVAKITAERDAPTTVAVNGVTTAQVDFTSKTKGPYGNGISLKFSLGLNESLPAGVVAAITVMSSGAGIPDIDDALNGLGTGDAKNEKHFTDGTHGYELDSTTLDKISTYNGVGNDYVGCYDKLIARPLRFVTGDTDPGSAALTALIAIGDARKIDRTNMVLPAPDSPHHPAALACGVMARVANDRPEEPYTDRLLPGIIPGAMANRWTKDYPSRDSAVKAGIGTTFVQNNAVYIKDAIGFYHPDNVPINSNVYRNYRNISITQNIVNSQRVTFEADNYKGITIVADKTKVTRNLSKEKVRDIKDVTLAAITLVKGFESNAWVFEAAFTITKLATGNYISLRSGGDGFEVTLPVVYSAVGDIYDTQVHADTSLVVITG
jgi:phage tail sheath gpL-like